MLRIKTRLAHSPIHGLGVFTEEDIPKNALIWSFDEGFDRRYTEEQFNALPLLARDCIEYYGFRCAIDKHYYLTMDNDRFTNHAETPNTYIGEDGNVYAACAIAKDEEITTSYKSFDLIADKKFQ